MAPEPHKVPKIVTKYYVPDEEDEEDSILTSMTYSSRDWDIGIGDSDGVIDTALIANSTIGQSSSGTDYLDAFAAPLDVSGKYLIFDVTTSATSAVAGTVEVGAKVLFGKKLEVDSGVA